MQLVFMIVLLDIMFDVEINVSDLFLSEIYLLTY